MSWKVKAWFQAVSLAAAGLRRFRQQSAVALSLAVRNSHAETARVLRTPPSKADRRGRLKK